MWAGVHSNWKADKSSSVVLLGCVSLHVEPHSVYLFTLPEDGDKFSYYIYDMFDFSSQKC